MNATRPKWLRIHTSRNRLGSAQHIGDITFPHVKFLMPMRDIERAETLV